MSSRPDRLADHLRHIVDAIDRAAMHIEGISSAEAFEQDLKTADAVVRCIEIIGEAATRITQSTPEFVARYEDVPWEAMMAMRNNSVGELDIDYRTVWQTVEVDLPPLRAQIVKLLYNLSRV